MTGRAATARRPETTSASQRTAAVERGTPPTCTRPQRTCTFPRKALLSTTHSPVGPMTKWSMLARLPGTARSCSTVQRRGARPASRAAWPAPAPRPGRAVGVPAGPGQQGNRRPAGGWSGPHPSVRSGRPGHEEGDDPGRAYPQGNGGDERGQGLAPGPSTPLAPPNGERGLPGGRRRGDRVASHGAIVSPASDSLTRR